MHFYFLITERLHSLFDFMLAMKNICIIICDRTWEKGPLHALLQN